MTLPGLGLAGVACALPARRVENAEFVARLGEKAVAEVTRMTGVQARHWAAEGQTAADLCAAAAERLLARLGWAPGSVDGLVFITQSPDQRMPATACLLHARLGLSADCRAFDVNLGCSGYVYGLWLGGAMMLAGCRRVLLLAGDTSSRMVDPDDRATGLLFGDAGSATALEWREGAAAAQIVLGTDGAGAHCIAMPGGGYRGGEREHLRMDGSAVFDFTLRAIPPVIREVMEAAGWAAEEVDAFALHQANRFILQQIARRAAIPAGQMPINIDRYGNTSSASIPLLLCTELAARLTAAPSRLVMAGFGVGLSWGAAALALAPLGCAELVAA